MLELRSRTAALRSVTVRSVDRDVLQVRRGIERALAGVEWTPPGLPPEAVLLVRRLAPLAGVGLAVSVSKALHEQASRASRPWLQAGLLDAEAVVFADAAELLACLVRDWLRGSLDGRWWWRSVVAGSSVTAWLRREAITRPQVLLPALALLEPTGDVPAFIARIDPADCVDACAAIAHAHAVMLDRQAGAAQRAPAALPWATAPSVPPPAVAAHTARQALARLLELVPEARRFAGAAAQRRLLAVTLAVVREPGWARSAALAPALARLDAVVRRTAAFEAAARTPAVPVDAGAPTHDSRRTAAALLALQAPAELAAAALRTEPAAPAAARARRPSPAAGPTEPSRTGPQQAPTPPAALAASPCRGDPSVPAQPTAPPSPAPVAIAAALAHPSDSPVLALPPWPDPALARPPRLPIRSSPPIDTRYAGHFYLLNAALSMGLYGDFTAPRAANLPLSPWDWLAAVGAAWFGDDFRADAAWPLLASLAGRAAEVQPALAPLGEGWLDSHLAALRERLAAAVGEGAGVDADADADADAVDPIPAVVCRHPGAIEVTATAVHVHLALATIDIAIRSAGLDRDPGWIPAAGRAVFFHFD